MSKQHLKQVVKKLYMDWMTYEEIQQITGVSKQTLCKWVNENKWNEERDHIDAHPETLSFELRSKLANNLKQIKKNPDGTFDMNWDELVKASATIEKFGGVDDPVASAVKTMDLFSKFIKSQDWNQDKKNHCFEAISAFLDRVGEEEFR